MEDKPEYTVDPASIERAKLQARLAELQGEMKRGEQMIAEQRQALANMEASLLRIAGAIQVLGELLAENNAPESPPVIPTPLG